MTRRLLQNAQPCFLYDIVTVPLGGEASCELLQLWRVIKQLLNRNRSVRIRHSRRQPDGNRLERTKFQLAPPVAKLFLDRVRAVLADGIEQALDAALVHLEALALEGSGELQREVGVHRVFEQGCPDG